MPFLHPKHVQKRSRILEEATLKQGLRHEIFSIPGDRYIGEYKKDRKDGKGVLLTRSDKQYEGDWERGYRHGYGILSTKLPDKRYELNYIGGWVNGKRNGNGITIKSGGGFYEGSKNGDGICYYPDGGYYEGKWKNGKRHGHGKMWFGDGTFYEGMWARDNFHGLGIFVQTNVNRYEGEWRDGIKKGRGIFYHLDSGQKQQGIWDNGIAVCSTMIDIYYRQSGNPPSEYPLQKNELEDLSEVYKKAETHALENLNETSMNTSESFENGIKELRNIVWSHQVDD